VYRRQLNLKANLESSLSYFSFKRLLITYRRYQRGFDRVNLHRPTEAVRRSLRRRVRRVLPPQLSAMQIMVTTSQHVTELNKGRLQMC
jgi:hypothetical protein